jgi:transcriptional regulator with XRE-family HTH domain
VSPAEPVKQTKVRTPLAEARVRRGMTQTEVAAAAGMSRTTYNKLERGGFEDPPLRYLNNCAIVLGVARVEELFEPRWREWFQPLPGDPSAPEDPSSLWRA